MTGTTGAYTWTVPGGEGVGDGNQLVLVDNRGPLNTPITYQYTAGTTQAASPVTRTFGRDIALQSLDGRRTVGADLMYGSQDTELEVRHAVFSVPGRRRPVVRYTNTGAGGGNLLVRVDIADSVAFDELLEDGAPLIWLMGSSTFDMSPVAPVLVTRASNTGIPEVGKREWGLAYLLVDDPYMDTRLGAFSWDDFDAAMASPDLWSTFDAAFTGKLWNQFDTQDWTLL
ncbi:hypothetical protein J2Y46_002612 [Microbacterium sp. BE35]|uniref:hypothetical protein n=1 Tax=Microbacterium sp. BE35 TaxID=2817773 RepID=UPI00285ECF60|nr:hypothetical protein [Microbacterium sp. BE35]MDR7189786.1 hypothetical protein [Microbacterium sp. BE35]